MTSLGTAVPLEGRTGPVVWRELVDGQEEAGLAKRVLLGGGRLCGGPVRAGQGGSPGERALSIAALLY